MAAVDGFNQKRNAYTSDRRSKKSWYRIFYFLFDAAVVNAFIQHNANNDISYMWSRLVLGRQLTNGHIFRHYTRTAPFGKNKQGQMNGQKVVGVSDEIRFTGDNHNPRKGISRTRCRWCSEIGNEARTKFTCGACKVVLVPFNLSKHASEIGKAPSRDNGTVLSHFSRGTEYTNGTYTSHLFLINQPCYQREIFCLSFLTC